jgi:hypothetical protein
MRKCKVKISQIKNQYQHMKKSISILFLFLVFQSLNAQLKKPDEPFYVKPYLQVGHYPSVGALQLLWQASDTEGNWLVEYKNASEKTWKKAELGTVKRLAVKGVTPRKLYSASFTGLKSGSTFSYRVSKEKKIIFTADAKSLKSAEQPYRFIAFGDIGAGSAEQKAIITRVFEAKPDLLLVPGDIVYEHGTVLEYDTRFWPVYNADKADGVGVPLIRSIPFFVSTGNHDTDMRDLDQFPDGLAYYYFWDLPLNGPVSKEGGPLSPNLKATEENRKAFTDVAATSYPGMTNYSIDYGNAHWVFLDSNPYVDCTSKELSDWLAKDLVAAKDATWRFVVFHHPGFNSSREHYEQQQMRLLSPVMEAGKVDIVFNGHVHNYQRSFPLKFLPDKQGTILMGGKDGKTIRGRVVNGKWTLDKTFDGKTDTTPEGIVYIITGAGGQKLYNPEQNNDPDSWQKFTDKFVSNIHSYTVVDVDGKTINIKQISSEGQEIDTLKITK